jgi:hypothetical protein
VLARLALELDVAARIRLHLCFFRCGRFGSVGYVTFVSWTPLPDSSPLVSFSESINRRSNLHKKRNGIISKKKNKKKKKKEEEMKRHVNM